MKRLLVLLLVITALFASCSSDTPEPSTPNVPNTPVDPPNVPDTPVNPPQEGSMLLKTTTEKYIVESTFQGLTDKVMEAFNSGTGTVSLSDVKLGNGFTVKSGTVKITSASAPGARAASDEYHLVIDITSATNSNEQNLSLDYVSSLTIENGAVTGIKPISTEAKLNDAVIDDIDSNTFIPLALAFHDTGLLLRLGHVMEAISEQFGDDLGITMDSMSLTVEGLEVEIDCLKSFIMPTGNGGIVFRLPTKDNQWHTMSSTAGILTIDGWAAVADTGIDQTETVLIKDDADRELSDEYVAGELAAQIYGIYYMIVYDYFDWDIPNTNSGSEFIFEADKAMLNDINTLLRSMSGDNTMTAKSFEFTQSGNLGDETAMSPENPGKVNIRMDLTSTGLIEIDVNIFAYSNDISDSQIVRIEIGGKDYSYLSLDVLKSMIRVFGSFLYISEGGGFVLGSLIAEEHQAGQVVDCTLTHEETRPNNPQLSFDGTVTVNIIRPLDQETGVSGTGRFSFTDIEVHDRLGNVTYKLSGNGSYNIPFSFTIEYFRMRGLGESTQADLDTVNAMIIHAMYMINQP